jgi:hypothetical protein
VQELSKNALSSSLEAGSSDPASSFRENHPA